MSYEPSDRTLELLADLVVTERPDWDRGLLLLVLRAHRHQVHGNDLAIAALRAASNHDLHYPKAIGWRGPHWEGLTTCPPEAAPGPRCSVCGKVERRCVFERPGRDDDHIFTPRVEPVAS